MIQPEPEERSPDIETGTAGTDEIEALKKALAEEKEKADNYLAGWQRTQADFANYKRRSEQEKEEQSKFSNSALMLSLLPVMDDFERAFASIPPGVAEVDWIDGVKLVERKLKTVLEAQGLSGIKALGEPFDPRLHEAVRQSSGEEGTVIEEVQKGYIYHDRVIRPSKVVVGNGATG
jgi:molecular chaperone GrpE